MQFQAKYKPKPDVAFMLMGNIPLEKRPHGNSKAGRCRQLDQID
jgi:hypothetical protein